MSVDSFDFHPLGGGSTLPAIPTHASPDAFETLLEALLQVRLECHLWKAHFVHIAGPHLPAADEGRYRDVWDFMMAQWIPAYTPEAYQRFAPLFNGAIRDMSARFDKLSIVYMRVLPRDVRKRLMKAVRQLDFASLSYQWIPARASVDPPDVLFAARFKGVIRVLALIARDADQRLSAMVPDQ